VSQGQNDQASELYKRAYAKAKVLFEAEKIIGELQSKEQFMRILDEVCKTLGKQTISEFTESEVTIIVRALALARFHVYPTQS
jgi:hypothetical protein